MMKASDSRIAFGAIILVLITSSATYLIFVDRRPCPEVETGELNVSTALKVGYVEIWDNFTSKSRLFEEIIEPEINAYAEKMGQNVTFDFIVVQASDGGSGALDAVISLKSMGAEIVIGSNCVACVAYNYIRENGMVLVSSSSTQPLFSIPDDSMFRVCSPDQAQAPVLAEMLESWGISHVIVLQRRDSWAEGIYERLEEEFGSRDITEARKIVYGAETTDFSEHLKKANDAIEAAVSEGVPPDRIGIIALSFSEAASIISQTINYTETRKVA